jgi:hypothetical protein
MALDMAVGRPPLPKEHGGWAMMATPPVVALLAAGPEALGMLAAVGWALGYCLRGPVEALLGEAPTGRAGLLQANPAVARFWVVGFGLPALAALAPVVMVRPWSLAWLGGALLVLVMLLWLSKHGQTRSLAAGALATAGLMAGGPLYYLAARGTVGAQGWTLALACYAFFLGSVFRVKTLAREKRSGTFRLVSVCVHGAFVVGAAALAAMGITHWLVALALVPPLGWSVYGAMRAGGSANLAQVGRGEQWLTISFGLLLALALRVSAQ